MHRGSKKTFIAIIVSLVLISIVASVVLLPSDSLRNRIQLYFERDEISQSVKRYFTFEMNRDLENLYNCLARSSIYRQSRSYEEFMEDVQYTSVRITRYEIIGIYRLRNNDDCEAYPHVQKFVDVEVEVTLFFSDTGRTSQRNQLFTFLKEENRWLKG